MELEDFLIKNIVNELGIKYQHIHERAQVNSFFFSHDMKQRSVTIVDDRFLHKDSLIYYTSIRSPINTMDMYQISFNWEFVDRNKLLLILDELFSNAQVDLQTVAKLSIPLYSP
jgi:hypothetical protein